jgi:hypothetical protein
LEKRDNQPGQGWGVDGGENASRGWSDVGTAWGQKGPSSWMVGSRKGKGSDIRQVRVKVNDGKYE